MHYLLAKTAIVSSGTRTAIAVEKNGRPPRHWLMRAAAEDAAGAAMTATMNDTGHIAKDTWLVIYMGGA